MPFRIEYDPATEDTLQPLPLVRQRPSWTQSLGSLPISRTRSPINTYQVTVRDLRRWLDLLLLDCADVRGGGEVYRGRPAMGEPVEIQERDRAQGIEGTHDLSRSAGNRLAEIVGRQIP